MGIPLDTTFQTFVHVEHNAGFGSMTGGADRRLEGALHSYLRRLDLCVDSNLCAPSSQRPMLEGGSRHSWVGSMDISEIGTASGPMTEGKPDPLAGGLTSAFGSSSAPLQGKSFREAVSTVMDASRATCWVIEQPTQNKHFVSSI